MKFSQVHYNNLDSKKASVSLDIFAFFLIVFICWNFNETLHATENVLASMKNKIQQQSKCSNHTFYILDYNIQDQT